MRWPGKIPAGRVCKEPAMTIDVLPTIAGLVGAELPKHKIDGLDIWPLISGAPNAKSPHEALFYYWGNDLQAVLGGNWKLHFPHSYGTLADKPGGTGGQPAAYSNAKTDLALYNMENDVGEEHDVAAEHPDIVSRLTEIAKNFDADLKRSRRPPGTLPKSSK
jgi:arylsulfatase A